MVLKYIIYLWNIQYVILYAFIHRTLYVAMQYLEIKNKYYKKYILKTNYQNLIKIYDFIDLTVII